MAKLTIVYGVVFILMGLYGYFGISSESITALIPAFFGIPMLIFGWIALNEKYLKHAMHGAAVLMLLGFIGTAIRIIPILFSSEPVKNPSAIVMQAIMSVLCLVFLVLAVKSLIDARRKRME